MNPFEMVIGIVLIITAGKVLRSVLGGRRKDPYDSSVDTNNGQRRIGADLDAERLQNEVNILKERIQVLERIATDNNSANDINRQIEQLRDR